MSQPEPGFNRELGLLDAAAVVAGAIVGVGIFANPSNVARILGDAQLILLAWSLGGALALLGGFAYAELGSRLPQVGGQYVYLARAYHPVVGFLYGVALLFIINGGALAAVPWRRWPSCSPATWTGPSFPRIAKGKCTGEIMSVA